MHGRYCTGGVPCDTLKACRTWCWLCTSSPSRRGRFARAGGHDLAPHRKTVIRHYALFLLSIWLILLALAVDRYGRNAGLGAMPPSRPSPGSFQAAGGLLYIGASPFFYYSLMGLRMPRWNLALFLAVDALAVAAAIAYVQRPARCSSESSSTLSCSG